MFKKNLNIKNNNINNNISQVFKKKRKFFINA